MKIKELYNRWYSLKYRCGNEKFPTYVDKFVCDEWKEDFYTFQEWSSGFVYTGMELDKDIIVPGNKVYSPETCTYIPQWLNLVLGDTRAIRGKYLIGVSYKKPTPGMISELKKPFEARCMDLDGKKLWLGYHETEYQAHEKWKISKIDILEKAIQRYLQESPNKDSRVVIGIQYRIDLLKKSLTTGEPILKL